VTGLVEEEEVGVQGRTLRRKSMARGSLENVLTALRDYLPAECNPDDFDLHINFPGGIPVDGPSAGVSMAVAIYSALAEVPVDNTVALTGEMSIRGRIRAVGGIVPKVEAARQAGVRRVLIPQENWQEMFGDLEGVEVVPISDFRQALSAALTRPGAVEAPAVRSAEPVYAPRPVPIPVAASETAEPEALPLPVPVTASPLHGASC
jgi:Lon-like ATP-dependent protease